MAAVMGQNGAAQIMSLGQDISVRAPPARILLRCYDIVAQPAQLLHNRIEENLIRVEQHRPLLHVVAVVHFVLADRSVDLLSVGGSVFPRRFEMGCSQ